ncbi:MAG: HEAT repeat domain-containing protein, partial [Gemmatimonadota bacterium]
SIMSDRREAAARSPGAANSGTPPGPAADRERVILLECRLEQMRSALGAAREEADSARTKLAESCAREADHARRYGEIHAELADARAEVASLYRRLERAEALKAEIEGYLFEAGAGTDAEELMRLRRQVLVEDQRTLVTDRTLARLRGRVEDLAATRETLLTRVAEWQQLIRTEGPDAADLSEFLAELRREILELEHRNVTSDAREMLLRERLAMAGIDPDASVADDATEAAAGEDPKDTADPVATVPEEPESVERPEQAVVSEEPEEPAETVTPEEPEQSLTADAAGPPEPVHARSRTEALIADLMAAEKSARRADVLLQLGRSGDEKTVNMIRPWTEASEPSVRAAAYEALGRLLERSPDRLEPHLRAGLADPDARVRRRVALAAATARGLTPRVLLEPLKEDPDPQVRRVVREVLRQAPPAREDSPARSSSEASGDGEDPPASMPEEGSNGNSSSVSHRSLRAR